MLLLKPSSKPCQAATASPRAFAATVGSSGLKPTAESWTGACHLPPAGRAELVTAPVGLASQTATASPLASIATLGRPASSPEMLSTCQTAEPAAFTAARTDDVR